MSNDAVIEITDVIYNMWEQKSIDMMYAWADQFKDLSSKDAKHTYLVAQAREEAIWEVYEVVSDMVKSKQNERSES